MPQAWRRKDIAAPGGTRRGPRSGFSYWLLSIVSTFLLAALTSAQTTAPTVESVVSALRSHDHARALSLSQELARAHPTDSRVWMLEGMALQGLGRREESLRAFEHALQIDPNNVGALEAAAQLEFEAGSPKALPFLEKLLRLNPHNQTAHAMMAALAFKRKDCPTTVAHYQESPQVVADNVPALVQFGACLSHLGRAADALPVFQRIVELQPQDPEALYDLGLAQYGAHHYADAIRTLLPLSESGPEKQRAAALNLLAAAYEANQQTPEAVAALQRAIPLAPDEVDNYLDLATISLDHGAFQVGVDVVNAGLHVLPDSAPLYLERGVLEVQMMDRYDQANADFQKAEALNPRQNYSSVALGISLLQENKLDESVQVVKQRLAKAPDDPVLNYLLAELCIRKGVEPGTPAFQEALAAARRALRKEPGFNLAADTLTELYLRSGQTDLAERTSRLALKSDPNDQSALYHLIVCLRKKGDRAELPHLVQRLAEVTATLQEQERALNRFKLVEEKGARDSQKRAVP
jgi:tetratricopeptide (TPR) repeat protein